MRHILLRRLVLSCIILVATLFLLQLPVMSITNALARDSYTETYGSTTYGGRQSETAAEEGQDKIQSIFNNLETIGNNYNSGGSKAAGLAALDSSCQKLIERFMQTNLVQGASPDLDKNRLLPYSGMEWLNAKVSGLSARGKATFCNMLKGEKIESIDVDASVQSMLHDEFFPMLLTQGIGMANSSNLPFLTRLEVTLGTSKRDFVSSITSVQPLWEDPTGAHHLFAQLSYYKAPDDEVTNEGFRKKYDTFNSGLAYRYLTEDQKYLYGANIFFDHAPKRNHNRMSIGADARTSQLAVSANRYIPLSDWKALDMYYEDRAAAGWDLEFRGQVPELPSWTASLKGYQWDGQDDGVDLYGATAAVEYSPVPAFTVRVGYDKDSQNSGSIEGALRFNYRFDQPNDLQWKPRTALAPVSDYVYEKVRRENLIVTKVRRQASSKLTVIQTAGANTAVEQSGASSLRLGQTLLMPVTVSTANTVGAIARLRFAKGATLTLGQNTEVQIKPDLITLVTGTIQFVSDGSITNIVVPGGTIVLHGTDIDVVSDGMDSSVRVRDGSITLTGRASGSATIGVEEMAESISGVVGTVSSGAAAYTAHTDRISSEIDRVATLLVGEKVAPYPYAAPYIVSENLTPGQQIVIGLKFNTSVVVSGGVPDIAIVINGTPRVASYVSGSGTTELRFAYIVQPADAGATSLLVQKIDLNGASVMGNGKIAVTTIADKSLPLSGSVTDVTPPSGYGVVFITDPVNNANKSSVTARISGAEIGTTYHYSITSSGGPATVTGSGSVFSATQNISGLNLSGLADGTLTISLYLMDAASNIGSTVTDTVVKDIVAPTGMTTTISAITGSNVSAASFDILAGEIGAGYSYTISSSGGGTNVTGSGTVSSAPQSISGINLSGLNDGVLTLSVTQTDTSGNTSVASTSTAPKDSTSPSGYAPAFITNPINSGNKSAVSFQITGAEVGASFTYTISSSGGGTNVTGSGTISAATHTVSGVNLSPLNDGTYTVAVTLTDASGNTGASITGTTGVDTTAPVGYAVAFTTDPVNNANKSAGAVQITAAEVGTTYNYTITSSGGGTPVTGSGAVSSSTTNVTGLNLNGLSDGTLTVSVTLTDASGNAGSAVTNTVVKDVVVPTGYSTNFLTSPINVGNVTAAGFRIVGAEVGAGYSYTISSSGGGTNVTGTGTISTATQNFSGLNLSGLNDGTLTVSMTLTDAAGNAGSAVTATVNKDVGAPTGYAVAFTTSPVNVANASAASFQFSAAEIGATYSYTITSSGGGTPVTGSGTIATATDTISGINLSALVDGTLTVSVTLTDTSSNAGTAVTNTVLKDATAPYITSVTAPANMEYAP